MKVAMLGAGFIGWGGGVDFLKAYVTPLQHLDDCEIYIFIPQECRIQRFLRGVWDWLQTAVFRKQLVRYSPPCTVDELKEIFGDDDDVHVVVYHVWGGMISNIASTLRKYHIDIVFPTMLNLGKDFSFPWIPYLPDLQHKYYPEFFPEEELKGRDASFQQLLHSARSVIVEAEDVKKDLQKFYSVGDTEIFVMPYTAIPEESWFSLEGVDVDKYNLPEKYFLVSNQFWRHKDHKTAFDALKLLHNAGYTDYHIVCTGKTDDYRDTGYFQRLLDDLHENNMEEYIHVLGYIPKADQIKILRQSQAALQPTLFEGNPGGGIAYNAISLGVPIILSDIPVNLELKSPLAVFFKKQNPESLKDVMIKFIDGEWVYPRYSETELFKQGERRLENLAETVESVLRYALGGNK
ncbi:glycosyltransferase [Selenomonas sp. F0473]|uniref:glycosyltransferase n=1 Tax=Selenomonas sp. F0473 TaxID=999423 RepID=UPI0025CC9D46|nr:glycosyltransferase [Selenomonas sp. F0473]